MFVLAASCAKGPPQLSPSLDASEGAFLTVEIHTRIVWSEITDIALPFMSDPLDIKSPFPNIVFREFKSEFLHQEVAPNGVMMVRSIEKSFESSLRMRLNRMLNKIGHKTLSRRAFRRAMGDGLLTCHMAITGVFDDSYSGVSGTDCVNNLFLSLPAPLGPDHPLLVEEGLMPFTETVTSVEASAPSERTVINNFPKRAWDVTWEEIRPIVEASTIFGTDEPDGANTCPGNIPTDLLAQDPLLAVAVAGAVGKFRQTPEGYAVVSTYSGTENPGDLWKVPCLPVKLGQHLEDQGVHLSIPPGLSESCSSPSPSFQ